LPCLPRLGVQARWLRLLRPLTVDTLTRAPQQLTTSHHRLGHHHRIDRTGQSLDIQPDMSRTSPDNLASRTPTRLSTALQEKEGLKRDSRIRGSDLGFGSDRGFPSSDLLTDLKKVRRIGSRIGEPSRPFRHPTTLLSRAAFPEAHAMVPACTWSHLLYNR